MIKLNPKTGYMEEVIRKGMVISYPTCIYNNCEFYSKKCGQAGVDIVDEHIKNCKVGK